MMPSPNHKARVSSTSLSRLSAGDAIRRGDLKISEPIPIPREGKDGLGPQSGVGLVDFQSSASLRDADDVTWSKSTRNMPTNDLYSMNEGGSPHNRATSYNTTTKISTGNLHDSISSAPSKDSRKPSGLKATIRRIFRRKDRPYTVEDVKEETTPSGSGSQLHAQRSPTRTSSLPIQNITRTSALNSHSPLAPFDVFEDKSRRPEGREGSSHRRRNTLPSVILSPQEEQTLRNTLGEATGRMSSNVNPQQEPEPMINHPNRRSRSAGALRETAQSHDFSPIQWRRQSSEIKTWHFPHESKGPRNEGQSHNPKVEFSRPVTRGNNVVRPMESAALPPPPIRTHAIQPAQSFDFGPLLVPGSDDSASIEQRVTTIEVKLIDLEYAIAKLQGYEMEKPTATSRSPQRALVENDSSSRLASTQSQYSSPAQQFYPPAPFLSTPQDSPNPYQETEADQDTHDHRVSGTPTLRPLTAFQQPSSSTLSNSSSPPRSIQAQPQPLMTDTFSYSHLLTLIQTEQSARRTLELQLQRLQREVGELRSPTHGSYKPQDTYPTTVSESVPQEQQGSASIRRVIATANPSISRSTGPSSRQGSGSASGTEHSQTQFHELLKAESQPQEFRSAFDDRSDDGTETDDDGYLDVYETPTETREGYMYRKAESIEGLRQHSTTQLPPKSPNYLTMI